MADQKRIVLRAGHASPNTIVVRALPVADAPSATIIYLYAGEASAKDVRLRNPSAAPSSGGAVSAILTQAIGDFTLAADASVSSPPVLADLTGSIGAFGLAADADVVVGVAQDQSIGAFALAADASAVVGATLTQSIGDFTLAAESDVVAGLALSGSIGAFGLSASTGVMSRRKWRQWKGALRQGRIGLA